MDTLLQHLAHMLAAASDPEDDSRPPGAELAVTDPDGREVYRAPLARTCRLDEEEPTLLWIRPLAASLRHRGMWIFPLSACRRRAVSLTAARRGPDDVLHLPQPSGQLATIGPAGTEARAELGRWDTFLATCLSADDELALDALREDSWYGPFA